MAAPAAAPRPSAPSPRRSRFALARARHRSVLRRPTDRWRSALVEVQVLALVAATVLCVLLGLSVYQQGRAHALQQAQHLRPVQAKVVGQPYAVGVSGEMAQVSWTAADGRTVQGNATVPSADQVGDHATIWLDASGNPTAPPDTTENTVSTAILTGLLALIGAGVVIGCAGAGARLRLNRMDQAAWEREWQVYEPLWTRRR